MDWLCCALHEYAIKMSYSLTKPTKWHVHPAKIQISLGIRQVRSEPSLSAWKTEWMSMDYWCIAYFIGLLKQ